MRGLIITDDFKLEQTDEMREQNIMYSTPNIYREYFKEKVINRKLWTDKTTNIKYRVIDTDNNELIQEERHRRKNEQQKEIMRNVYNKSSNSENELIHLRRENEQLKQQMTKLIKNISDKGFSINRVSKLTDGRRIIEELTINDEVKNTYNSTKELIYKKYNSNGFSVGTNDTDTEDF